MPSQHISTATELRRRLEDPHAPILSAPGVYDGFSARIALEVGFDAMYMTGAGTSASVIGQADLGILGLQDMRRHAEMIANLDATVPLIADADTGYGGPVMVARTVREYARAGVAGCHIEDQVVSKRCGHLQGKELVDRSAFVARISAAAAARKAVGSDLVIIARTDALQSLGWDESIARLRAARDAGADAGFLEGITSTEQAAAVVRELAGFPMLLNMVYSGATPAISASEAHAMGFRIVIFPFAAICPAYNAMRSSMQALKRDGELGSDGRMAPRTLFEIVGLEESLKIDANAGGVAYSTGV